MPRDGVTFNGAASTDAGRHAIRFRQQWLPHVPLEALPSPGQGIVARVVAASAPAAGAVREARGAGAVGTRGERRRRRVELPQGVRFPTADELAELEREIERQEWAADGGDGSVWSDDRPDPRALNLEWILRGPLLEALAAITWKPLEARREALEEPENYSGAAA